MRHAALRALLATPAVAGTPLESARPTPNPQPQPARAQPTPARTLPGTQLETTLHNGKLPIYQAKDILRQVLRALAHCHCQGITHRNLKPKYLLLRESRRGTEEAPLFDVRLSDFNSVRWLGVQRLVGQEALYGTTHVSGACSPTVVTQPYRAPEILLGCTAYSTAIDIWALGCVFVTAARVEPPLRAVMRRYAPFRAVSCRCAPTALLAETVT